MAWDRNYAHFPRPVAQFDPTACWAAGLEWWLKCMHNSRTVINQLSLINKFVAYWNHDQDSSDYGTVTGENLGHIMDDASINMSYSVKIASTWDRDFVIQKLAISPVLIGYLETEVNGFHVNIIHSLNDASAGDVNVMDPNRGRFRTRSHIRFNTGNYVLGWAR